MRYSISLNIDPNKVFLVKRSELEGRFDPKYIEPIRLEFYSKLRHSKNAVRLKEVIKEGSYGILPPGDSYDESLPIKFIRATELKEDLKVDFENVYFVERKYYTKRAAIKQNDILLAVKGATIAGNKCVSFVSENVGECIVNGSIFRMQINERANPLYVAYLLNSDLLKRQMKFNLVANNAVDYLDKSLIYNLLIPLPSYEEQEKIVDLFQNAYAGKEQKEAEAKALLESIDTYLLGELGINLPEQDNSLEKRIFTTRFSEVGGGRMDPRSILNFKNIISQNSHYPIHPFKDVFIKKPQYGANEEAMDGNENVDTRYIRITDIDEWGNLKRDTWKTANKVDPVYLLNENDILIARTGATVGKAFIYKEGNGKAIFAGYMIRFLLNHELVNPDFIFYYLNSSFYKYWISAIQRPSAQPNINSEEYKSLPIPLPPLEKQTEIANHIQNIRSQANALQHEAASVLEEAKHKMEKMILGE